MGQGEFLGPVNIGSEEMVTINQLAQIAVDISGKSLTIENLAGKDFEAKYDFQCPIGVRGRNSHNRLYEEKMGWVPSLPLAEGMSKTYTWIAKQVKQRASSN